jgi:hypothetical protein
MPNIMPEPYVVRIPGGLGSVEEIPAWPVQWAINKPVPSHYYVDLTHPNVQKVHNGTPEEPLNRIPRILGPGTLCVIRNLYDKGSAGKTKIKIAGTDGEWVAGRNGKAFVDLGTGEDRASFPLEIQLNGQYGVIGGLTNRPMHDGLFVGSSTEPVTLKTL